MYTARFTLTPLVAYLVLTFAFPLAAELETVEVGGEIRIRGNYWIDSFNSGIVPARAGRQVRLPAATLWRRPVGYPFGGEGAMSFFDWDSKGHDYKVVTQRTALNVKADFTNEVSVFTEIDSVDVWGEDLRSNYVTGSDVRPATSEDIGVYQAYIEADNMFGYPVRVRIGRQELGFGSGWLVGNNSALPEFSALSFDAILLTYKRDTSNIAAFWAKLAEGSPVEEDGDIDFYGLYSSYAGFEDITLDAYWLLVRDARAINDTDLGVFIDWLEAYRGVDDYGVTYFHTLGLRASGALDAFDFEAEVAYQFGKADQVGALFSHNIYGDNIADFSEWAMNLEVGYTLDIAWQPRLFLAGAYIGGEDNRDISFFDWLNPLDRPHASISFNRLFSNKVYSLFLDDQACMSNFWLIRSGVTAVPTENIEIEVDLAYLSVVDEFDLPAHIRFAGYRIPIVGPFSFWTDESASDIGWELNVRAKYHYTEDLSFEAGWSHLFTGGALEDGNYNDLNGLFFNGGTDSEDADYFYCETAVRF